MAKTGRLAYWRQDGVKTTCYLYNEDDGRSSDYLDICGTDNPLQIKWKAGRYDATLPSHAKLSFLVEDNTQRTFLDNIFNGGYVLEVHHDTKLFWVGKVRPTLGSFEYRSYPYGMQLEAICGLQDANKKKMLNTDFPDPWNQSAPDVSVLDMVVKIIGAICVPKNDYTLKVANILTNDRNSVRVLDRTYLDPLCFMDADDDNYLPIDDILDSLLGPLHMRLFQWKAGWYLMSLDTGWNNGKLFFETYTVSATGVLAYSKQESDLQGIIDLFATCDMVDGSGTIDFIAPLIGAEIKQKFQMNQQVLPVFANRSGSFYRGDDGIDLELKPAPAAARLRHWTDGGLTVTGYHGEENEGSLFVPVVYAGVDAGYVKASFTVPNDVYFNKFFFSANTVCNYRGEPFTNNFVGVKREFLIKYINGTRAWYFWRNNAGNVNSGDAFDGWTTVVHRYTFDHDDVSSESLMPDNSLFNGGTFEFYIYAGYDDNFTTLQGYGYYLKNLKLGIHSSQFSLMKAHEKAKPFFKREWVPIVGELLLSPMPIGVWSIYGAVKRKREKARNEAIGGIKQGSYTAQEIKWDDTITVDIQSKGMGMESFEYVWGLHLKGTDPHHCIHISSPYNVNGHAIYKWMPNWDKTKNRDLLEIKSETLINDNYQFNTVLKASYVKDMIDPLHIYSDVEGRKYRLLSMVYDDRRVQIDTEMIEYKGLNLQGGGGPRGSFDINSFDDSFDK